jgi:hypothetical protein
VHRSPTPQNSDRGKHTAAQVLFNAIAKVVSNRHTSIDGAIRAVTTIFVAPLSLSLKPDSTDAQTIEGKIARGLGKEAPRLGARRHSGA